MNPQVHDIALATGGSHWPTVGGRLLEASVLMAVRQCATIAYTRGDTTIAQAILEEFGLQ
jgi:hypothetical protein